MNHPNTHTHKTIVITGASSGLGAELALQLAHPSNQLVLFARREDKLKAVKQQCEKKGANVHIITGDVTQPTDCERLINEAIAHFGAIHLLINNAGISLWQSVDRHDPDSLLNYERVMAVNYFGTVYCTLFALPHLQKTRGLVVAISSIQGKIGVPLHAGYAASKHAVQGFFDSLDLEVQQKIHTLIVSPGWIIDTELRTEALGPDCRQKAAKKHGMTAAHCCQKILHAMEKHKRTLIVPSRMAWLVRLRFFLPKLANQLIIRAMKQEKTSR